LAKWLVNRPRPKNVGYGFPSGHVLGAWVFRPADPHRVEGEAASGWSCLVTVGGVVLVVGVAFSRIYLNASLAPGRVGAPSPVSRS